eukprot:TRINITY_DN6182_c0_g1_i1.p1 TRINITY_DN6182_c0_g1~~TRINITY_DN6182_c0_g1_i1.p1  ORF type:complete len:232 (-),score=13.40 TRINITY_DN6182_c0_g1_i1:87-782(-)
MTSSGVECTEQEKNVFRVSADSKNAIREAMDRAGLKHVVHGLIVPMSDLTDTQQRKLEESNVRTRTKMGLPERCQPHHPDLLRSLLKWHVGNIGEKKRIWNDFFSQWSKEDLRLFLKTYELVTHGTDLDPPAGGDHDERRDHPFVQYASDWAGLVRSHPYSYEMLIKAINQEQPTLDKDAIWSSLVNEYLLAHPEAMLKGDNAGEQYRPWRDPPADSCWEGPQTNGYNPVK